MSEKIPEKMIGMKLPGGAKVEKVECDVPKPGPGQVLLKMKAGGGLRSRCPECRGGV